MYSEHSNIIIDTHFVPVISIINSVLCFGFVMGWLFAVAIPEWREATWHTALSYETCVSTVRNVVANEI